MDDLEKLGWFKDDDNTSYLRYYKEYSEINIYQIDMDLDNGVSLSGAIEVQDVLALAEVLKDMLKKKGRC